MQTPNANGKFVYFRQIMHFAICPHKLCKPRTPAWHSKQVPLCSKGILSTKACTKACLPFKRIPEVQGLGT